MGLLSRGANFIHRADLVDAAAVINAQNDGPDIETVADGFIHQAVEDANLGCYHMWSLSAFRLAQLATASMAYGTDYIAGSLLLSQAQAARQGKQLAADVADFALNLTNYSKQKMAEVDVMAIDAEEYDWTIDGDLRDQLYPANHMPAWPREAKQVDYDEYPWQDPELGIVSDDFIRGITGAGLQLYTRTISMIDTLDPPKDDKDAPAKTFIAPIPAGLQEVPEALYQIANNAYLELYTASQLSGTGQPIPPGNRVEAYRAGYTGLVGIMFAGSGIVAPATINPDFVVQN
jgi:hypothetical protein